MKTMRKLIKSQSGQGMTEYIIIVSLIAISCIAGIVLFGDHLRRIFGTSTDALANKGAASTNAEARYKVFGHRSLNDFGKCVDNPYACR